MKMILAYVLRFVLRLFFLFPMRENRIFFIVHGGRFYNCSPKYIYRYLGKHCPGEFEAVWCLRDAALLTERYPKTEVVRPYTFRYFRMALTSGTIVSNTGFSSMLPKRRGQIYMNTWHGGGSYKKCGLDVPEPEESRWVQIDAGRRTDVFLSCSADFSRNMSGAKHVAPDRFAKTGTPRNDIFFGEESRRTADRLRKELGLASRRVVLYAPTFRGTEAKALNRMELDVEQVTESLGRRFGGRWEVLVRRHPFSGEGQLPGSVDVSAYQDMQELLCLADVLITDYSSCLWDYSLTGKPCFVLAGDIGTFEEERGFYLPVSEWPYPVARDNRELSRRILDFDADDHRRKIREHHRKLGSYESGTASEQAARILMGMGGRRGWTVS